MKSSIRKTTFKAIYRLLDHATPLSTDCGKLCQAACCHASEQNLGIYLYPGEDKLFSGKEDWLEWEVDHAEDYDFPDSWYGKIYFIRCKGPEYCERKQRPLQCRFFPLTPHLTSEGKLILILYPGELPYRCPLIDNKTDLEPSFIRAVYTVWSRLIQDPLLYDLVRFDSDDRDKENLIVIHP